MIQSVLALDDRLWIFYNTPKYVVIPPQSLDVNPIEHVWGYLKKKKRLRYVVEIFLQLNFENDHFGIVE